MKTYVIYAVKSFDCIVDSKEYHCVRAMIGEVEKLGSTWKVKSIKLITRQVHDEKPLLC